MGSNSDRIAIIIILAAFVAIAIVWFRIPQWLMNFFRSRRRASTDGRQAAATGGTAPARDGSPKKDEDSIADATLVIGSWVCTLL